MRRKLVSVDDGGPKEQVYRLKLVANCLHFRFKYPYQLKAAEDYYV